MKIELRLPTQEQYAYIGVELVSGETLTDDMIHEALSAYNRATGQIKGMAGIPDKDFNAMLDEYIGKKTISSDKLDLYEKLSPVQRDIIQAIKRSYQRLKK